MIKTIIADKSLHQIISKQLSENKEIINNIKIIPLYGYLNELLDISDNNYDNDLRNHLKELESKLSILNNYLDNQTFINEIKQFHISMYLYDINVDDLNEDTLKNKDLKIIYKHINNLIPNEITTLNKLKAYTKYHKIENTYYSKNNYNDYQLEIIKVLENSGVKLLEEKENKINKVNAYFENNIRSEIEASAQLIVNNKLDNALVIALNDEYFPLIKTIYNRYNIDYSMIVNDKNQNFTIGFISIINLIINKDHKSLINFLSSNPFNLENIFSVSEIIKLFNYDLEELLNHQEIILDDPLLFQSNIDYYNELKEKAKSDLELLKTILRSFNNLDSITLIENIFNYLLENNYHPDLNTIKNKLFNNKDLLNNQNIIDTLNNILLQKDSNILNPNKVVVTKIFKHYYFNNDNVIILGATNKNFPNIKKLSGVIDEVYVENLKYPSKTIRFNHQLEMYDSIKKGVNINIFYPLSSYAGKAIEPAFSLLNFAKKYNAKNQRYNLVENDKNEYKTYKLDADIAKELFLIDDVLYGSISSLERYNRCPYAYFLQYGLKLYPKELPNYSSAYMGSLVHKVIEEIIDKNINNETFDIDKLINEAFLPLELLNDSKSDITKFILNKQIKKVYKHLESIEKDTYFKPIETEYKFTYNINDNIKLVGYIDRIDAYNDYIRVLDYKSSKQILSESEFKKGLQLQLITYLLVASEQLHKKPAGAFYSNLKIQNSSIEYAKATKSKDFYYVSSKEDIRNEFLKNNKLSGWHFEDTTNLYFSSDYVDGLRIDKNDNLSIRGGHYNFETIIFILNEIYQDIYDNISSGIIDCLPVNNPCQFCKYQSICQTSTSNNFKAKIYDKQNLKKERDLSVHK